MKSDALNSRIFSTTVFVVAIVADCIILLFYLLAIAF
jgi:hypothetical protein